jgi:carbonic anhydrase/acetyltransferase-like protein (isoleucine patch superfamily)
MAIGGWKRKSSRHYDMPGAEVTSPRPFSGSFTEFWLHMVHPFRGIVPSLDASVFLAPSAEIVGDVVIGARSSVWFNATVRGDVHWIRIGEETNIQDNAVVHVTGGTGPATIGNRVTVGHSAVVHACTIEDRVLIGMGAIVLDQAVIGTGSIVGAGALVTGRTAVPPGSLVYGNPARVIRPLTDEERASIDIYSDKYLRTVAAYREAG